MQPILAFASPAAFEAWLETNHDRSRGIWLKINKGAASGSLSYQTAIEVALCFGWVDWQGRAGYGRGYWLQKFAPRRVRRRWSQANRGRAEALIASGRMRAPGLCQIERAQAAGRLAVAHTAPSNATAR